MILCRRPSWNMLHPSRRNALLQRISLVIMLAAHIMDPTALSVGLKTPYVADEAEAIICLRGISSREAMSQLVSHEEGQWPQRMSMRPLRGEKS